MECYRCTTLDRSETYYVVTIRTHQFILCSECAGRVLPQVSEAYGLNNVSAVRFPDMTCEARVNWRREGF
jgi:predicted metal-binding protein